MALAVLNPVPQFHELDGSPLDAGSLYFGQVNQNPVTHPATVYWDADATIPAAQPIATSNGFPMRNGTPAIVYASADFSLLVRNRSGEQVLYARNSADFGNSTAVVALFERLANPSDVSDGDAMVVVLKDFTGAEPTDQHEVNEREYDLYDSLTLQQKADFRSNSLALDLTVRLQAALDSGATVVRMRPGKVKTTSKITKPNTVRLQGDGEQASWIVAAHNGTVMECSGATLVGDAKQGVFDVGFTTTGGATPAIGLLLANLNQTWLQRVRFEGGYVIGLQEAFCLNSVFDGLSFIGCTGIGQYIFSSGPAVGNNGNEYSNFNINDCATGIRLDGNGTYSSRFRNIKAETCSVYPVEVVNCQKAVFDGLYLEGNVASIQLSGGTDIVLRDCTTISPLAQQFINTAGFGASQVYVDGYRDIAGGGVLVNPNVMVRDFGQIRFPSTFVPSSDLNTLTAFRRKTPWTPADASGAGLVITNNGSFYTRVGDMVFADFDITFPLTANANNVEIGGMPFPSDGVGGGVVYSSTINTNSATSVRTTNGGSTFFFESVVHSTPTNADFSTFRFKGTLIYRTAS